MMSDNPYASPGTAPEHPGPGRRWIRPRVIVSVLLFTAYCLQQWFAMTRNTSFEHHPFSGPLILIHTSGSMGERFFAIALFLLLSAGILAFPIRPTVLTFIVSVLSVAVWFAISIQLAAGASC